MFRCKLFNRLFVKNGETLSKPPILPSIFRMLYPAVYLVPGDLIICQIALSHLAVKQIHQVLSGVLGDAAARNYAEKNGLRNVDFLEANAYHSNLPPASFDLVHARFMFAPLGQDQTLLSEMIALARPGGIVVSQESDESGYLCYPPQPAWERLKQLTVEAFARGGGDYSAGRRMYGLFCRAGLENVQARAACLALPAGHPYRLWPIESALAFRLRFLEWGLITVSELDDLLQECERIARDPETFLTSFVVIQIWGRKPGHG